MTGCVGSHTFGGKVLSPLMASTSVSLVWTVGRCEATSRMLRGCDGWTVFETSHVVDSRGADCAPVSGGV